MNMTLDAWGRSVDGRSINRYGNAGAQCWDLWADYAERAVGVPIAWKYTLARPGHPDHYLASTMWLFFPTPRTGDLGEHFVRLGRDATAQAGDVAVWARSKAYPLSHIAVATGSATDGLLPCWTQNPGARQHARLTTAGLLGHLRPKALEKPEAPTPQTSGTLKGLPEMFYLIMQKKHTYLVIPQGTQKPRAILLGEEAAGKNRDSKLPVIHAYSAGFTMEAIKKSIDGVNERHLTPVK